MNRIEAEQLAGLMRQPGWATYMKLKENSLAECHKALEWEEANVKKLQGKIEEIRLDLGMQKKVTALLEKL